MSVPRAPTTKYPIYTEVDDINQVRRTFRQIKQHLGDLEVETPSIGGDMIQVSTKKFGQSLDDSAQTLLFDKINLNTNTSKFAWDATLRELTIQGAGRFDFDFRVTVQDEGDQVSFTTWLEKYDTTLGMWTELEGTRAFNHTKA